MDIAATTMIESIFSIKDERIIFARELNTSKFRALKKACLLEGKEHIQWALNAQIPITHVFIHDKILSDPFVKELEKQNITLFSVSDGILKKITDTSYLIPFIGVADLSALFNGSTDKGDFIIVLDALKDYGNIGTIIRTCAAFGIHTINFTQAHADPFFKKTIDASRGTVFTSTFHCFNNALETVQSLKNKGYQIVATSPHGKTIQNLAILEQKPIALICGNETEGCSDEVLEQADLVVQIPMYSAVESLNVAVATGISIYELRLKMVIAMLVDHIKGTLGRNLSVALQLMRQVLDQELKKVCSLSSTQYILLMVLACDQVMSVEQISRDFGLHGAELESTLQSLEQQGFIAVKKTEVSILPSGQEIIAKLWPIRQNTDQKILQGFSESEKKQLSGMLERIHRNCESYLKSS